MEDINGHARRFFLFLAEQPKIIEDLVCQPSYYDFGERVYREQMSRYKAVGDPFAWLGDGKAVPPEEAADLLSRLTCRGVEQLMCQP